LGTVRQTACPGENRRNRIGRRFLALLMFAKMTCDRAMRGLSFDRPAVRRHEYRGHEAEGSKSLRDRIGLDIAIIVLAGPYITARPFERRGHHVVNQAVLIGQSTFLKRALELGLVNLLKQLLESPIIG